MLIRLGGVGVISGYPEEAVKWSEQALPIYERLEDPEGIAQSLHYIAEGLRDIGELERSAELYNRAIEIRREHDLGSIASSVHSLGDLSLDKHDLRSAEHYYQEALAGARDEDDVRLQTYCLAGLACVAAHNDEARTAGRLWTLAERIEQRTGFRMLHAERVRYEQTLTPALRDSIDYRAGVASAVDLDPPAAVAELLRS